MELRALLLEHDRIRPCLLLHLLKVSHVLEPLLQPNSKEMWLLLANAASLPCIFLEQAQILELALIGFPIASDVVSTLMDRKVFRGLAHRLFVSVRGSVSECESVIMGKSDIWTGETVIKDDKAERLSR